MNNLKIFLFLTIIPLICGAECVLKFSETSLTMPKNEERNITLFITDCTVQQNITFGIQVEYEENLVVSPNFIQIEDNNTITSIIIQLRTTDAGEAGIYTISSNSNTKPAFIKVEVYKYYILEIISIVIGWTYFVTWTISFYPQVYTNHTRKSVVGLNFDFVVVNITGYTMYSLFNVGLYWIPLVRQQYEQRYPLSVMSVMPNDIFFALHGLAFTLYIGLQCLMYEKGGQKVSWFGKGFHVIIVLVLIVSVILCFVHYLLWLDFLYICSYIKLVVTFCKYGPQAIMNYKRRSTKGWSIGAVLLDVVGGFCSIVQMFMNVYNYNENLAWLLSNPTKLWLGIFSLLFDLVFVIQHYCLYNGNSDEETPKVSEDKIKFEKENNNCIKA